MVLPASSAAGQPAGSHAQGGGGGPAGAAAGAARGLAPGWGRAIHATLELSTNQVDLSTLHFITSNSYILIQPLLRRATDRDEPRGALLFARNYTDK